jgi:hypothetical protein
MQWTVETLDIVDAEIDALPPSLQARLLRLMEMVERIGLEKLRGLMSNTLRGNYGNCVRRQPKASRAGSMSR